MTIVHGHTGCGKTTQIPQFVLDNAVAKNKFVNIVVTQPRRIAATSVARRVAYERKWELGRLVGQLFLSPFHVIRCIYFTVPLGYKVGMDREHCSEDTRLLFCTTGVLKKMLIGKSISLQN